MTSGPFKPEPPYAVWTLWPRYKDDDPVTYCGRVLLHRGTREVQRCNHRHATRDEAQACGEAMLAARPRHIVEGRVYCHSTQRYEVSALCGAGEEASGSGWHGLEVGSHDCPRCLEINARRGY